MGTGTEVGCPRRGSKGAKSAKAAGREGGAAFAALSQRHPDRVGRPTSPVVRDGKRAKGFKAVDSGMSTAFPPLETVLPPYQGKHKGRDQTGSVLSDTFRSAETIPNSWGKLS